MIELHEVEGRMKRAKPEITVEPDFVAKVMEEVGAVRVRRNFTIWRRWAMAVAVLLVVVAGGAFTVIHRQASQTVADQTQKSQTQTKASNPSSAHSAAQYQKLASSAQSDLDSMSQQTASFTDNDYGDSQLADSVIF